ncbi:F-box/kelch-repeat protein At5g15710-like [Selaginella moellendorffii]|uniref:F-box/kelch-repeat protein At5g15710-like n=1 Tax=Selaginella moellendorffii TaxID=88036 RepID=UPI000D1C6D71|nr:F-box/kelch-repeat protein At5g15710-like [Selaginella moellendorffii]|eukprot:XP_024522235.1 F-box/kelch-repeat protein At5g15710-like [Selaginella moellendorffii]
MTKNWISPWAATIQDLARNAMESEVAGNTPITHLASISEALSQGLQNLCRIDEDSRGEVEQRAASSLDSEGLPRRLLQDKVPASILPHVRRPLPPQSSRRLRRECLELALATVLLLHALPVPGVVSSSSSSRGAAVLGRHGVAKRNYVRLQSHHSGLQEASTDIAMKSPYVVGMVVDDEMKSYKILVAQDGETLASQVYDSSTNRWSLTGVYHRRTAILAGATFYNGLLFCLTFSPNGLLAFDLERGQWLEVKLALPPSLSCPNLMTHQDRLLLIGGIEELGSLQSVHVWQLHPTKPEWMDVERVPDDLFQRLFTSSSGHFICVGQGDFICLHEYYSPEILMYDIVRRSWQWLPGCSLNDNIEARSVLGFAFQPRIEAVP